MRRHRYSKTNPVLLVIMCVVLLIIGIHDSIKGSKLVDNCTQPVTGVVSKVSSSRSRRSHRRTYKATVEYKVNEKSYKMTIKSSDEFSKGEKVDLFYNPSEPSESYAIGYEPSSEGSIISAILGIIVVGAGAILLPKLKKREEDSY